jgi:hypothetical protein
MFWRDKGVGGGVGAKEELATKTGSYIESDH